jgi:hypothetical protein
MLRRKLILNAVSKAATAQQTVGLTSRCQWDRKASTTQQLQMHSLHENGLA